MGGYPLGWSEEAALASLGGFAWTIEAGSGRMFHINDTES